MAWSKVLGLTAREHAWLFWFKHLFALAAGAKFSPGVKVWHGLTPSRRPDRQRQA